MPSKYNLEAMKRAIIACDANIKIFEAAIQKERKTKVEYQKIIRDLEEEASHPKVKLEIVKE